MRYGLCGRLGVCGVLAAVVCGAPGVLAAAGPVGAVAALADKKLQQDFPAMCLDADGTPWVAYVAYDGKADVLKVARKTAAGLKAAATLAGPGMTI